MIQTAKDIISTFDQLSVAQQKEVSIALLRRNVDVEMPDIADEELVLSAEELFLDLDEREALDA